VTADLVDYTELTSTFLDTPDGVVASDHYLRGRMACPFTAIRPESGMLQITFTKIKDNNDGTYTVYGNTPSYDKTRIAKLYVVLALADKDGKHSANGDKSIDNTDDLTGDFTVEVSKSSMSGDPQKIIFSVDYLSTGKTDSVYGAVPVDSDEIPSNFIDSSDGVITDNYIMQGRLSYPFVVCTPEIGLLKVIFKGTVRDNQNTNTIYGNIPTFDKKKISDITIKAALVDRYGKCSGVGSVKVGDTGDFTIQVDRSSITSSLQKIVFSIKYGEKQ
jgi:hypothetical protein